MHRAILGVHERHILVDHRNFDTLNNTKGNLRLATVGQNKAHTEIPAVGFSFVGSTYYARIRYEGELIELGKFRTADAATEAYDTAHRRLFGEFSLR